jgi:uncharacterized protein YecE (DUF72 family)
MTGNVYIGTSGWSFDSWSDFYAGVRKKDWLRYASSRFTGLEVNGTFYHRLKRSSYERWRDETPPQFRFAIKAHRYLTHVKRLEAPRESFEQQRKEASGLGEKLAVVLWQLPANLHRDDDRLKYFVGLLDWWPETRHALEFRHPSWFHKDVARLLKRRGLAVCQSDAADWPLWDTVTTDLVYVRLHGHEVTYVSPYRPRELREWVERIRAWSAEGRDVHVYFDNTDAGNAPRNALTLLRMIRSKILR